MNTTTMPLHTVDELVDLVRVDSPEHTRVFRSLRAEGIEPSAPVDAGREHAWLRSYLGERREVARFISRAADELGHRSDLNDMDCARTILTHDLASIATLLRLIGDFETDNLAAKW